MQRNDREKIRIIFVLKGSGPNGNSNEGKNEYAHGHRQEGENVHGPDQKN
jgi:hypothetical protein